VLLPLFERPEASAIGEAIRKSLWLFPVVEAFHPSRARGDRRRDSAAAVTGRRPTPWNSRSRSEALDLAFGMWRPRRAVTTSRAATR